MHPITKDHLKSFAFWLAFTLIAFFAVMRLVLCADGQTIAVPGQTIITTVTLTPPAPNDPQKVLVNSVVVKPPPPLPAVSLSWTGDSRATNYILYVGHGSGNFITNWTVTGTNATVTNLNPKLPYVFSVAADGSNGLVTPPCLEARWNVNSNVPMQWVDAYGLNLAFVVPPGHAVTVSEASSPLLLSNTPAVVTLPPVSSNALVLKRFTAPMPQFFKVVEQ